MIKAYNELYLKDAMRLFAHALDYAINDCMLETKMFINRFLSSKLSSLFEKGNPSVVANMSGVDLVKQIYLVNGEDYLPDAIYKESKTREYWAGYYLAYYQWYKCISFKDIFLYIDIDEIISMYKIFHEEDMMRFVEEIDARIEKAKGETKLRMIRVARGMSQRELANAACIKTRIIQLYEQRVNDIDKAQVHTLFKISIALGCDIEDLLENPAGI